MNSLFTFLIAFFGLLVSVRAQESDNYYKPIFPETLGSKMPTLEAVLEHYGPIRTLNRWYVGAEGFLRNDKNTISNTFDGLINTRSISDWGFGASVGWVYREEWALEASYLRTPIYNVLTVTGSNVPLEYTMANDRNSLTLRAKRRLLFGKATLPKSAFWVGVGISAIPNSGKQKEYLVLEGRVRQGRLPVDTLRLESITLVNDKITGVIDASIEYILKPAKGIEFSVYGRNQWGLGNSIATKIDYTINRQDAGTSRINGNGSGWVFGISLRYVFHTTYDFDYFNRSYKGRRTTE